MTCNYSVYGNVELSSVKHWLLNWPAAGNLELFMNEDSHNLVATSLRELDTGLFYIDVHVVFPLRIKDMFFCCSFETVL